MVWESLHNVDGDSCFCDSDFHLSHSLGKSHGAEGGGGSPEKQLQVDQVRGALGAVFYKQTSCLLLAEGCPTRPLHVTLRSWPCLGVFPATTDSRHDCVPLEREELGNLEEI